jgi:CheY-like chemotaxis protein
MKGNNGKRRILIVDDNEKIHNDFRKLLIPTQETDDASCDLTPLPVERVPAPNRDPGFELEFASNGEQALDLVRRAAEQGTPYMLAFVDVRMPPGWDGIETTARLWGIDPEMQIVICTAYSDFSWRQMTSKLNRSEKFIVLKKPFEPEEVLQLAHALCEKWRLKQELDVRTQMLEEHQALLRVTLETTPDMIFVLDGDMRVLNCNRAATSLLAVDRELLNRQRIGQAWSCVHAHELSAACGTTQFCEACRIRSSVRLAMAGQRVTRQNARLELQRPQGPRNVDVLVSASPVPFEGDRACLLLIEDLTQTSAPK